MAQLTRDAESQAQRGLQSIFEFHANNADGFLANDDAVAGGYFFTSDANGWIGPRRLAFRVAQVELRKKCAGVYASPPGGWHMQRHWNR